MSNAYAGRGAGSLKSSLGPAAPNFPSPGIGSQGAYLIGAKPFMARFRIKGANNADDDVANRVYKVVFPGVTRKIVIKRVVGNDATALQFSFQDYAADQWTLPTAIDGTASAQLAISGDGSTFEMEVRSTELYLFAPSGKHIDVEIFAEITSINAGDMSAWGTTDLEGVNKATKDTTVVRIA